MPRRESNNKRDYRKSGQFHKPNKFGSKPKQKDKRDAVMDEKEVEKKGLDNDPNWYFIDPEVAKQAGELSFQQYLGVKNTVGKYTMPTVMTIHLNPCPGNTMPGAPWATGNRSGFNMSMTKMFNRLSMKSGRNMAYAPQDVGAMTLGVGELLSMVSFVRRLFGVVKWWNIRNRAVPKEIVRAMGIDPDDFFTHFSDYRMRANTLILACNQIPILTNCGYLRKCASMYDKIYVDVDAGMAQYYMYVPFSTWILNEQAAGGTRLETTLVCSQNSASYGNHATVVRTFAKWMEDIWQPMVTALLESSTLNLVYADVLNLNKTEDLALATIDVIDENYAVVPEHDVMVLKQIHNSVALGWPVGASDSAVSTKENDVVPDPNTNSIVYSPVFPGGRFYGTADPYNDLDSELRIIDTDTSDPDLAEKVEITRYISTGTNSFTDSTHAYMLYAALPDHYVTHYTIITDSSVDASVYAFRSDWVGTNVIPQEWLATLTQFDWHPIIYHYYLNSDSTTVINWIDADLNSFTTVNPRYLQRLTTIINMDLFEFR